MYHIKMRYQGNVEVNLRIIMELSFGIVYVPNSFYLDENCLELEHLQEVVLEHVTPLKSDVTFSIKLKAVAGKSIAKNRMWIRVETNDIQDDYLMCVNMIPILVL